MIGLLRLLLAITVVSVHSGMSSVWTLTGSTVAVETFFIISGFYMALVYNEKYTKTKTPYWSFFSSRILKIYPMYYLVLVASFVLLGYQAATHWWPIITNLTIIGQDWLFLAFSTPQQYVLIPQAWTLGVELTFYALAPFLVTKSTRFVLLLMGASMALRVVMAAYQYNTGVWSARFFPFELMFFMAGILSYKLYVYAKRNVEVSTTLLRLITIGVIGLTLLLSVDQQIPMTVKQGAYQTIIVFALPFMFLLSKDSKVDRWFGDLSYPTYIIHVLIITLLTQYGLTTGTTLTLITITTTITLSAILILLTKPLEQWRTNRIKT